MNRLLIILMLTGLSLASYEVGDTVTLTDQNIDKTTCIVEIVNSILFILR